MGVFYTNTGLIAGSGSAMNIASLTNPVASGKFFQVLRAYARGAPSLLGAAGPFLYHLQRTTGSAPSGGSSTNVAVQSTSQLAKVATTLSGPSLVATGDGSDFWADSAGSALSLAGIAGPQPMSEVMLTTMYNIVLQPGESLLLFTDGSSSSWHHWAGFVWSED